MSVACFKFCCAALCAAISWSYISAVPKAPCAFSISLTAVFVQNNVKINSCFYAANTQSCKCELVDRRKIMHYVRVLRLHVVHLKSFNAQLAIDYPAYSMVICQVIDKLKLVLLYVFTLQTGGSTRK